MNRRHRKVTWTAQLVRTQSCELRETRDLLCDIAVGFVVMRSVLKSLPSASTQPQLQDELEPPALSKAV